MHVSWEKSKELQKVKAIFETTGSVKYETKNIAEVK